LQPAFIASYIRSPQAWDPKIWMPNKKVSDPNIQKMVQYLSELAKEQGDAK
jgi:cytochrome c1